MSRLGPSLVTLLFLASTLPAVAQVATQGFPTDSSPQAIAMGVSGSVGVVSGSVVSMDSRPVGNARVELRDLDHGSIVLNTMTNANGSFSLYNIPPGQYEVVATSGISESHERVQVGQGDATVTLRINAPVDGPSGSGSTVSVAQYKVPQKARKEYDKAQDAFSKNKFDEARQKINKAIEIYPTFAEALTLRGILAIDANQMEQGEADLQQAIKYDANYGMAYFALGAAFNQQHKFDDALRSLERGIIVAPDGWQGHFEIAKASLGKGDFDRALKSVIKAEKLSNSQYPPLHLVKAHALLGLKDYQGAVAELERYLSREPNGAAAARARQTLDRTKAFVAAGGDTPKGFVQGQHR